MSIALVFGGSQVYSTEHDLDCLVTKWQISVPVAISAHRFLLTYRPVLARQCAARAIILFKIVQY